MPMQNCFYYCSSIVGLDVRMVIAPDSSFIVRCVLAILGFLLLHMKLSIILSRYVKNDVGVFMGIVLNLLTGFGKKAIFTMLILSIHEHEKSFHFVKLSVSFFNDLKFLSYRSLTCLVRVTPIYFIFCMTIIKNIVFLISILFHLTFVHRKATDGFYLILHPVTLLKEFISCKNSLVAAECLADSFTKQKPQRIVFPLVKFISDFSVDPACPKLSKQEQCFAQMANQCHKEPLQC